MIGFETIGNATLTVIDDKPVLTTDPWINGKPYFGSWTHQYEIPEKQLKNILSCKYVWLSHGHPDHIDPDSLELFKDKTFIVADHFGDRIYEELTKSYNTIKLKSNSWFNISKNIRIKSFADWNQDSALLVEVNKDNIIFNLNDGSALGWSKTIKNIIKNYKNKFLLKLINWGDADMINFYNHHNEFILPLAADKKPCGESYSYYMKKWNCNFSIPFSAFHKYNRTDSIKMNDFCTPLDDHYKNFDNKIGELLPAFITWDTLKNDYLKIEPKKNDNKIIDPKLFGDNWDDNLNNEDRELIKIYFEKFYQIKRKFGFIVFKVGSSKYKIKFSEKKEGIEFSVPRNSLMNSIKYNIFDDLLIGNFMKVKLLNIPSLYPDFTPYVTKYGDNGFARSKEDLENYFNYYKLNSANYWIDFLKLKSEQIIRNKIEKYKPLYYFARNLKRKIT
tara:strand:+ start:1449 stop:2786 length:1338 start_codon:yes stop_codon:yes gene_type:complete